MTHPAHTGAHAAPRTSGAGSLFGVPLGDLGWFGSLLIGVASGFLAFFASTFCAIVVIMVWNTALHSNIDFADSYKFVGLPIGSVVMACALGYLGTLWIKRVLRKS